MNDERLSELIREADRVPEAPDCRAAVMDRIRAPRRRSYAWAYACAVTLVAIVGMWALIPHELRQTTPPKMVKKTPTQPKLIVRDTTPPKPVRFGAKNSPERSRMVVRPRPHRVHVVCAPQRRMEQPSRVVTPQQPETQMVQVKEPEAPVAGRPVAIAIVKWPSQQDKPDTYSYGYTDHDTRTGETTVCRVKRSGDSVEIYMESKPEAEQPPVKGSIGHETIPSV